MDGHKPLLRKLLVATLAISGSTRSLPADEFIRQPPRQNVPSQHRTDSASPPVTFAATGVALAPRSPAVAAPRVQSLQPPTTSKLFPPAPKVGTSVLLDPPQPATSVQDRQPQRVGPIVVVNPFQLEPPTEPHAEPQFEPPSEPQFGPRTELQRTSSPSLGASRSFDIEGLAQVPPAAKRPIPEARLETASSNSLIVDAPAPAAPKAPMAVVTPMASTVSTPPTASTAPKSRRALAANISHELTAAQLPPQEDLESASALEPAPGWQAVGEQLKGHLAKCEELLSHNAYLSAREESNRAILQLIRNLDLRQNKLESEPAWAQAQQALREAQDFTAIERIANDSELFTRLIQSHETPVLRGVSVAELTPLAAAQHYRAYAQKCLIEASQGHPWFSELYYCIGRTLEAQSQTNHPQANALLQHALTYYRSAYAIQPSNAVNSNQLGYVLLRMDRPAEAFEQLAETVRLRDCPLEAWQNLVQASSRLGDKQTEQWAAQSYMALRAQGAQPISGTATLVEVDPKQFAAMSPYTSGPRVLQDSGQTAPSPASSPAPAPKQPVRTAAAAFSGFFR